MDKPSAVERVANSPVTDLSLTAIAAYVGGPLAALLPPLAKSLAAGRQTARIQQAIDDVNERLTQHADKVNAISDDQHHVICEAVAEMFQTTHKEKLDLLRDVIDNALTEPLTSSESTILSRIVRDISASEAAFLRRAFGADSVMVVKPGTNKAHGDNVLRVDSDSPDAFAISGLLSLGVLLPGASAWGGAGLTFTPAAAKLLALIKQSQR